MAAVSLVFSGEINIKQVVGCVVVRGRGRRRRANTARTFAQQASEQANTHAVVIHKYMFFSTKYGRRSTYCGGARKWVYLVVVAVAVTAVDFFFF